MKITTNRICVFILLWVMLIIQGASQRVLLTTIYDKCFTNTSSALAALYDLSDESWKESGKVPSRFTDVKYVSENSKKICENLKCIYSGNEWKIKNSLEPGPIDNLVTDRRWEDFPMYVTKHIDKFKVEMQYQQVAIINSIDFVIPFSLHSRFEAHLLLCDNTPVRPSRCYWLMLQAWGNTKTAFRTCERYEIQEKYDGRGPKGRCFSSTVEMTNVLNMFSEDKWSHFKIAKSGSELQFIDEEGNALFKEKVGDIAPRYVFVHSKAVNGLWKIHNFNYLYSDTRGITLYYLNVAPGQQCLSMFIAKCKSCSVKIEFLYYYLIQENILYYEYFNNKIDTWQHVMFCFNTPKRDLYLRVTNSLITNDPNIEAFWALNDIRTGQKYEFRYLSPDPPTWTGKCQSLKSGSVVDKNAQDIEVLESWNVCTEDQFGEDCFPCNHFNHGECLQQTKYCQLVNDSFGHIRPKCYCSIGYKGSNCEEHCSGYKYGHSCQRSCKNCQDGCKEDTKFGKCKPPGYCSDNYVGDKCDIPHGIFLFVSQPKIEAGFTECRLTQTSFEGKGDSSNVKFYKFQFRENIENDWRDVTEEPLKYKSTETVTLRYLKSETTYQVRVFGYGKLENLDQLSHLKESIKIYNFTTYCKTLDENHVNIFSDSTSVNVSIQTANFEHLCKFTSITINDTNMERKKDYYYVKDNLEPYTLYRLSVRGQSREIFARSFRTMEAVPSKVRDFRYEKCENNSIDLYWKEPEKANGRLLSYTISKLLTNRRACTDPIPVSNATHIYVASDFDSITLSLMPYSKYEFTVRANTSAGFGEPSTTTLETDPIANITAEEIPLLHETGITSTTITFSAVDCQHIWGPMTINIRIEGKNTWCVEKLYRENHNPSKAFAVTNLKPFCNYTMTLDYIRDKYHKEDVTDFTTKEEAPNPIDEKSFLVTSKGSDHISMRWLPPNPPTGQLEMYQIKISKSTSRATWTRFNFLKFTYYFPKACKLWPEYHCVAISEVNKNYFYKMEINSKNKGYDGYSSVIEKKVQAIEIEPGKPDGLNVSWTNENYLTIQWRHPLQTNGILKGFQIFLNSKEVPGYEIGSEDDYLPTYSATIKENLEFPKDYGVAIKSQNPAGNSQPTVSSDIKSPPPIPNYSVKAKRNGNSIKINLKEINKYYTKEFERYLYVLISDCTTCKENILEFKEQLLVHHRSSHDQFSDHPSHWRLKKYDFYEEPWDEEKEIVITATEQEENFINNTYSLGFIWIYRHEDFVRSNLTIEISEVEKKEPHDPKVLAGAVIAVIVLVLVIAATVFAIKRFREGVLKNTRGMFASNAHIIDARARDINEPIYENQQEISLNEVLARRRTLRNRPFSVLVTDEICPGVPTFQTDHSRRIKLETFYDYVKNAIESGELKIQHDTFPRGKTKEWAYGTNPENMAKNRYQNLIAYDHSRVVLNKINGDEYSDYINANYIDGYRHPKAYIATQGPKKHTVADFWRMIWQERVTHIVMMANVIEGNKKKTEQYWPPNINDEVSFGDYTIAFVSSEIHADYDFRTFEVQQKYSKPRQVRQLHFKVWPDHGIPLYAQSLEPFLHRLLTLRSKDFPLVVHCSAGVGRTGTIILCDICLRMAASEGYIDAFAMLEHLRNQRPNMVDNVEQYKLAHLVILNCLMGLRTSIPINADFQETIEKVNVASELNYIRSCEWQDDAMKTVALAYELELPVVPEKNRFSIILPDKAARVILHPYPQNGDNSTYINAVHVDGYCQPSRYVVTQFPLPNTIGDFWRLVAEKRISVIVCLNEVPPRDQTCEVFWPKKQTSIHPEEVVHVEHVKDKNVQGYSVMTFKLSTFYGYQEKETRKVEIIKFNGWKYPAPKPDYNDFISFVEEVTNISRNSEQVLVTCYDGATASGLFIAMSFLMELIKLEQQLDVCQAVRSIRISRKEFVNSKEQLQFLYKASLMYVEGRFAQYSNINFQH